MPPQNDERFPPYEQYLDQHQLWPRYDSDDDEVHSFVPIGSMAQRHAASALAKLYRWAQSYNAGVALNINAPSSRLEYVKGSLLAGALIKVATLDTVDPTATPARKEAPDYKVFMAILRSVSDWDPAIPLEGAVELTMLVCRRLNELKT